MEQSPWSLPLARSCFSCELLLGSATNEQMLPVCAYSFPRRVPSRSVCRPIVQSLEPLFFIIKDSFKGTRAEYKI
jgi:hypothetical protein